MEQAIKIARKNGYGDRWYVWKKEDLFDPLFWQALGKGLGWDIKHPCPTCNNLDAKISYPEWIYQMHRFIDHLAEGKDIDSFFIALLPPPQPCPECVKGIAHPHK